jgi:hypothetical protein
MSESESFEATVDEYNFGDKALFLSGKRSERERIIKLLEDEQWHDMVIQMTSPPKRAHSYDCIGCKQIALIKGETNEWH